MPRLAMVAVLETKPDARADSTTAWRACISRRATRQRLDHQQLSITRRNTTRGFSSPP